MKTYKNLTILGTSHISIESIKQVKDQIIKIDPQIIALELDKKRFLSLISNKKDKLRLSDIKRIGIKGYIFNILGAWLERKLGESVGVLPGTEMKTAIELAKKTKARIALIDQDIEITLKKLSKRLTWKEKFRFVKDIIKGIIFRKPEIKFDLRKVPSERIIKKLIKEVKKKYPSIYLTLIKERNEIMAKHLYNLINHYPDKQIFAVIGAGHEEEIVALIKNVQKTRN